MCFFYGLSFLGFFLKNFVSMWSLPSGFWFALVGDHLLVKLIKFLFVAFFSSYSRAANSNHPFPLMFIPIKLLVLLLEI